MDSTPVLEGLITQARAAHSPALEPIAAAIAAVELPSLPVRQDAAKLEARVKKEKDEHVVSQTRPGEGARGDGSDESSTTTSRAMLLLRNVKQDESDAYALIKEKSDELQQTDVGIFVFDGTKSESFRAACQRLVDIATASGDVLPCVLVALVPEGGEMPSTLIAEAGDVCGQLRIQPPLIMSSSTTNHDTLSFIYLAIVSAAYQPGPHIPETPSLRSAREFRRTVRKAALGAGVVVTTGLFAYLAYRLYKSHRKSSLENDGKALE